MSTVLRKITAIALFLSILTHSLGGCCAFHHDHAVTHNQAASYHDDGEQQSCCCPHQHGSLPDGSSSENTDPESSSLPLCCDHDTPCFLKTRIQEDDVVKMPVLLVTDFVFSEFGQLFVPDAVSFLSLEQNTFREPHLPLYLEKQLLLI